MLVNELHPAADSRIDYEQSLRRDIFAHVSQSVEHAAGANFTDLTTPTTLIDYHGNEGNSKARPEAAAVLHALDYEPDRSPSVWMIVAAVAVGSNSSSSSSSSNSSCTNVGSGRSFRLSLGTT